VHERALLFVVLHAFPHPPQLATVVVAVSHPSICKLRLQSANPPAHVPLHMPPPHVRVAMLLVEHWTLQPPQLFGSVDAITSHPFVCLFMSQSRAPLTHMPLHTPPAHVRVAMLLLEQLTLHPPQLFGSVAVSFSQPSVSLSALQSLVPLAHAPLQMPPAHVGVGTLFVEQTLPTHPPQWFGSVLTLISQPSVSLSPLQSAYPLLQAPTHCPAAHTREMLFPEHDLPTHAPQ